MIKNIFLLNILFISLLQSVFSVSGEIDASLNTHAKNTNNSLNLTSQELQWLDKKQPITYVYDPDWPPFEWTNGIQEHTGIIADILSIIADKTGIEFRPVQSKTWSDAVKRAKANKVDMYSAVAITKEREKYLNFTSENIYSYLAVFISDIRNNDYTLDKYDRLEGKTIALIKGNLLSKTVKVNYPKATYVFVDSAREGFDLVNNKQADLFAINAATATYFIQNKGYSEIKIYKTIDYIFNLKIGLQKDVPNEVLSILDKAILSIGKKQLSDIFHKWTMGKEDQGKKIYQILLIVSLIILAVTMFFLIYVKLKQYLVTKVKDRLELAIIGSKDVIWDWNIVDNSIYFSDRLREILGYNEDEFPNKLSILTKCTHPDDLPTVTQEIQKSIDGKIEYFESSYRLKNKQGKWLWVLNRGKTHYNSHGKAIRISGTFTDIHVRKELELALYEAKNQYQRLVENIGEKFIIFSHLPEEGHITYLSGSSKEIFGLGKECLIGELWADFVDWLPGDLEATQAIVKKQTEGKLDFQQFEMSFIHPDNTLRTLRMSSHPVKDESGTVIAIDGIIEDITARKRDKENLRRLEAQLQQAHKMESIGTLAGGIAHEFNNMLAIIMCNNEFIMEELQQGSLAQESTEEIRIAGLRARDVVKQLLTFSRQDDAVTKVMDFKFVVQESMKLIRSSTPANIKIDQNLSEDTYPVVGNAAQINQILINLCNNAVGALPEKGGVITIELLIETIALQQTTHQTKLKPGQYAKLLVSDNGIGMASEILDRLFEPYFTTKDIGDGTGIGMAVVHGIVERHGGAIIVASEPALGTTCTIFFPIHEGSLEQKTDEKNFLYAGDEHILYVDDEPSLASLGKRLLESLGYTTESTTDPERALDMVRSDPTKFDLLITDMAMPNMTGDQLIIEILKIRQDMPTIICTGYSATISETEAADIGIGSFIMKPINKFELSKVVRNVLDGTTVADFVKH